ncbi:MAG: Uncharacterised protein [Alphaproteobacteria bacterium]|nr:MAG: Uncharacterised protein [Alphaproteobacteria bacterium]
MGATYVSHFLNRKYFELRIGQRLGIKGARFVINRIGEILRVIGVNKAHLNAHIFHRIGKQIPCAAIQIGRRDDIVTGARNILNGHG